MVFWLLLIEEESGLIHVAVKWGLGAQYPIVSRTGGFSNDQFRLQHDPEGFFARLLFNGLNQGLPGQTAHSVDLLANRGQFHGQSQFRVVEADHGKIFGNAQVPLRGRLHDAHGQIVVSAEDGVRTLRALLQRHSGIETVASGKAHVPNVSRFYANPAFPQRLPVALQPLHGRRSVDQCDLSIPALYQVPGDQIPHFARLVLYAPDHFRVKRAFDIRDQSLSN